MAEWRTAEHVSDGHPDKFCDQVADRILDEALRLCEGDAAMLARVRTAIECLAKDNVIFISGETALPNQTSVGLDVSGIVRDVWREIGYEEGAVTVINHIGRQSADIAQGAGSGVDHGGAGDQGIMVGYATAETPEMMPREWVLARDLCWRIRELRRSGAIPWLRSDTKSQVTLDGDGRVDRVVLAAHHAPDVALPELRKVLHEQVVVPVVGEIDPGRVTINGTGAFTIGGPEGDAGVVGRKIVVDAYGPRVPVGGGAYSGKDPTKVDRSAAYMCRHIAKTIVANGIANAKECTVSLAYAIGQLQPEMVKAVTQSGEDVSSWVQDHFKDLSPRFIIESLGLRRPTGWSYFETASFGHYGRSQFPWERIAGA